MTSASNIFSLLIRDHKSHHYSRHSPTSENDPSCRFAEEMKSWEGLSLTIDKERESEDDEQWQKWFSFLHLRILGCPISSKSGFHFWILCNVCNVHWTINKERERERRPGQDRFSISEEMQANSADFCAKLRFSKLYWQSCLSSKANLSKVCWAY